MAVSLWDMMRPVAMLGGVSAAASEQLGSGVASVIAASVFGLAAGLAAFAGSGVTASLMLQNASEASFRFLYVSTFLVIGAGGFFGGRLGAWALHAVA